MLRLAGLYADAWLPALPMLDPATDEGYAQRKSEIARHAVQVGRAEPEPGLYAFNALGDSREHVRAMFEREPLAKLITLHATRAQFQRYGQDHRLGEHFRNGFDVIPHDFDAVRLRELAQKIPFELVDEIVVVGNVDEVVCRIRPYAEAGCEHMLLGNVTGLAGGPLVALERAPDMTMLCRALKDLPT
jgi:phthiodiolone/phenolphthiodiolone dimycocerosates ketoreductase